MDLCGLAPYVVVYNVTDVTNVGGREAFIHAGFQLQVSKKMRSSQ